MPPMLKRAFPILCLAIFSSLLGSGIIVPLFPLYVESIGATGTWLGIIFAGFHISRAVIMPLAGKLSDRRGRKLILEIGLFAYALTSFAFVWADNVASLTVVRILQGIAAGMVLPIAQAYVGDIAPKGEEGKWMGYFNAAFITGFGVGPLMGGTITEHLGMDIAFYTMGGFNLLAFFMVIIFLPEISSKKITAGNKASWKEISASRLVQGIFSYRLTFSIGRGVFAVFLPIFAGIHRGLSPSLVGILLAFNILLMASLQIYGGKMADRHNRRYMVALGGIVNLASLALIPLAGNFWQLMAVCALGGIGGAISMPATSALVVEEGRKLGMGLAMAAFAMAFSIGMAIGPVLAGVIADSISINAVFYFGAIVGLAGTVLFIWLTRGYGVMAPD